MRLELLSRDRIADLIRMENNQDTAKYILPYTEEKHSTELENPLSKYIGIYTKNSMIGFIILGIEEEGKRIELRRIVIEQKGYGYGQRALEKIEHYCKSQWNTTSIWLDVFEDNERGLYIYKKLGYKVIKHVSISTRKLFIMEKQL